VRGYPTPVAGKLAEIVIPEQLAVSSGAAVGYLGGGEPHPALACPGLPSGSHPRRAASSLKRREMSPTASHTGRRADDRRGVEPRHGTEAKRGAEEYERELRRQELAIGRALTSVLPSDRPARLRELAEARRVMSGAIRDLQRLTRDLEADLGRYSALRSHTQREVLAYEAVGSEIEEVLLRWEARCEQLGAAIDKGNRRQGGRGGDSRAASSGGRRDGRDRAVAPERRTGGRSDRNDRNTGRDRATGNQGRSAGTQGRPGGGGGRGSSGGGSGGGGGGGGRPGDRQPGGRRGGGRGGPGGRSSGGGGRPDPPRTP
jgi:pyruvate/2-oxoglutarate dehydrogenase complex dihydrolipoamide acyltransferase (E2) component